MSNKIIDTYQVKMTCSNCGNSECIDIPKGISISDFGSMTNCTQCGCKEMKKSPTPEFRYKKDTFL